MEVADAGARARIFKPIFKPMARACLAVAMAIGLAWLALFALWRFAPPISTLMAARYLTGRPVQRIWVPLDEISPALIAAVAASEDARFCRHAGVDWQALSDAMEEGGDGGPARGASTIAMQTAKNLFLWPSRSYLRKGLEIPLALALGAVWPKRRIMEVYLNIAEWGPGVFGAEAAAQTNFGASARDLNWRQAALLATSLPNPLKRRPARPSPGHWRLAARLFSKAVQEKAWLDCLSR